MNDNPEFSRQLDLEEEMTSRGIDRYVSRARKAREEGRESQTAPIKSIIKVAFEKTLEKTTEWILEVKSKGSGYKYHSYNILSNIDLELATFISLRVVLDGISTRSGLTSTALRIANAIEDELHYRAFKDQQEGTFKKAVRKAKQSPSESYKRRHLREIARKKGVAFKGFTLNEKVNLGTKLIELVIEATGLVEVHREGQGGAYVIQAAPGTLERIEADHERLKGLAPMYLPTIIPPKPWTSPYSGGYWSGRVRRLTLVKTRHREYLDELAKADLTCVYEALNAVQATPWRINRAVFEVMNTMWTLGIATGGVIPSPDNLPLPPKPHWLTPEMKAADMTNSQREELANWKREAAQVYSYNAKLTCARLTFDRMFGVAARFAEEPEIYFPHQLDFRGRMYPVPLFLHPQGSEDSRALLEFAKGKPLGTEEAVLWLASHGAGMWGIDKVSFRERLEWVRQHEPEILSAASDPLTNLFWTTAEKPWSALAFCFEWAGFKTCGLAHVSHIPIQMDGSCNGLQHFSAMLRDPIGGAAVNLVPSEAPRDIYQAVADVVAQMVEDDAANGTEHDQGFALGWLGRVTRKVCKRPTMTLCYGARQYGFTEQVFADTITPWKLEAKDGFPFSGTGYLAAQYMARRIWEATNKVVVGARGAMEALQKWTSELSKVGRPVYWTTPSGFIFRQEYTVPETYKVKLAFGDVNIYAKVRREGVKEKLDKRKQTSAVSPNFVHALDAAHLCLTVSRAAKEGIECFSMIHDSYGTHAADCPKLGRILREEFVRMYENHDVLSEFRAVIQKEVSRELAEAPPKGSLDLSVVLKSPYFFG